LARLVAWLRGCVEMMVLLDEYIDKKRRNKFPYTVYKEIQMRSDAKSYMRKSFLMYAEMYK
jgi:hypothetical protein